MWADRVKYYFQCKELNGGKPLEVPPPRNHKEGNGAKYERDEKSRGIMLVRSNELEFIKEGYDALLMINSLYGVIPDLRMQRWAKSDKRMDEKWQMVGEAGIDLTNIEFDHTLKVAKAGYTNGGLADKLNSRMSEVYDLIEATSVNGEDIGTMPTVNVTLTEKYVFLRSEIDVETGMEVDSTLSGGDDDGARAIPFQIKKNPDGTILNNHSEDLNYVTDPSIPYGGGNFVSGRPGSMIYTTSDRDRRLTLNGKVSFVIRYANGGTLRFGIIHYKNGNSLDFDYFVQLGSTMTTITGNIFTYNFENYILDVAEGGSWTIGYHHHNDNSDGIGVTYLDGNNLVITEDSSFSPTVARAMTQFQVFDRLMARAFGRHGLFRSDLLSAGGKFSDLLKTNGFFIRQFPDIVNQGTEEERRIQFKTSLKNQLDALEAILPIAWFVEKDGDVEVLRVEELSYTQQNFVGIHYGTKAGNGRLEYIPVQKMKRTVLGGNYYSSAEIGSTKTGSDYEDYFGLTSFNGKAVYNFINDTKGSPYTRVTEDRTGDIDVEITRRRPFDKYPDTDTQMDDDIFFLDCKKSGNNYVLRTWQDDFEEAPIGVYRPDSAYNFRFSPARLLLNHGYVVNTGLQHYPFENIRFASSNCNSAMVTYPIGEDELPEGSSIPHSRLGKARVRPMSADFEMPVPEEIEAMLSGRQPDGTPNWYGRVAVEVDGAIEYFRVINVDTNKEGKHKMIEAN